MSGSGSLDAAALECNLQIFLQYFAGNADVRRAKPGSLASISIPAEVLVIIAQYTRPTLKLVRANSFYRYACSDYTPACSWLQKFMKIERIKISSFGGWMTKSRLETVSQARIRFQSALNGLKLVAWDHVTRFYIEGRGTSSKHQFLLYEPYTRDKDRVDRDLRKAIGDDNFAQFVQTRMVPGGMQVFIFGPEIDQNSVMESSLFLKHSYFSLKREENKHGYMIVSNYDLHSMPCSHRAIRDCIRDFTHNQRKKNCRRCVSIKMQ